MPNTPGAIYKKFLPEGRVDTTPMNGATAQQGDAIVLQCEGNLEMVGDNMALCNNGAFQPPLGTCSVPIPKPPTARTTMFPPGQEPCRLVTLTYGNYLDIYDQPLSGQVESGIRVKLACPNTYQSSGPTNSVCNNGEFQPPFGICVSQRPTQVPTSTPPAAAQKQCTAQALRGGFYLNEATGSPVYEGTQVNNGNTLRPTCDPSYIPASDANIICRNGRWVKTKNEPIECIPRSETAANETSTRHGHEIYCGKYGPACLTEPEFYAILIISIIVFIVIIAIIMVACGACESID